MTKIDWTPLRAALAACRRDAVPLPLWWRDDDAVDVTPALDRLLDVSDRISLPVHLAIIPAQASPALAALANEARFTPVVHGWAHADHSRAGEKKNEFQTDRPGLTQDSARAFDRMTELFGPTLCPIFVPPWNRIQTPLLPELAQQGYRAVSTYGPRAQAEAAVNLSIINTHVDPIWWRGNRDLAPPDALVAGAAAQLEARRTGVQDRAEPFGLLTHHLVHTPAIWSFAAQFAEEMLEGGAVPWTWEPAT